MTGLSAIEFSSRYFGSDPVLRVGAAEASVMALAIGAPSPSSAGVTRRRHGSWDERLRLCSFQRLVNGSCLSLSNQETSEVPAPSSSKVAHRRARRLYLRAVRQCRQLIQTS